MTSIMHPALAASRIADQALNSLTAGNDVLLGQEVRPMHEPPPGTSTFARAAVHGETALGHISRALGMGVNNSLSRPVMSAFLSAQSEAQTGVHMLRATTLVPADPNQVVLKFDGAKLWLDMAKSLIQLDLGGSRPQIEAPEAMAR